MPFDFKNKKKKNDDTLKAPEKLKLIVTIIPREKSDFYADLISVYEVNMQQIVYGFGTAPKEYDLLNLSHNEKAVIFSFVKESNVKKILNSIEKKFNTIKNGKGICFVQPIDSIIGVFIYNYLINNNQGIRLENKNGK